MTRDITLAVWAALCALAVFAAVLARVSKGRVTTLPDFLRSFTTTRPRAVVLFVLWMWTGWHFFAR